MSEIRWLYTRLQRQEAIEKLLDEPGMSVQKLAVRVGVWPRVISAILNGSVPPGTHGRWSLNDARRVDKYLGEAEENAWRVEPPEKLDPEVRERIAELEEAPSGRPIPWLTPPPVTDRRMPAFIPPVSAVSYGVDCEYCGVRTGTFSTRRSAVEAAERHLDRNAGAPHRVAIIHGTDPVEWYTLELRAPKSAKATTHNPPVELASEAGAGQKSQAGACFIHPVKPRRSV